MMLDSMYFTDISDHPDDDVFNEPNPRILPNGQLEKRVPVDRRLLDRLLSGEEYLGEGRTAEDFFSDVMVATGTTISYPPQMRFNKGRKDPHVKIIGRTPERIAEAEARICSVLSTRRNRVTIKMDVAFTDHSHIIGRGGRSIQKVMDDTGCHIHFPDSNRTSTFEKSNQVSVAGTSLGAEQARCRIRDLLPLTINYEIPLSSFTRQALDSSSSFYLVVQRNFGLTISFQPVKSGLESPFDLSQPNIVRVSIRGSKSSVMGMRQGCALLLEQMTGNTYNFSSTPASMETEIAAQNHQFVMGKTSLNIRHITQKTGAFISFPDQTANGPFGGFVGPAASSIPNKKSTVCIKGPNFDAVYLAWQELIGFLPLVLIFDLKENQEYDALLTSQLSERHKVSILMKPKSKQNVTSIMVRGQEKDSRLLFEVRRQLLGLDESEVPFCCETHYWSNFSSSSSSSNSSGLPPPFQLSVETTEPKLPTAGGKGLWPSLFPSVEDDIWLPFPSLAPERRNASPIPPGYPDREYPSFYGGSLPPISRNPSVSSLASLDLPVPSANDLWPSRFTSSSGSSHTLLSDRK